MKELIYSQEDLDLILSLETEEKDKEIERLNNIINEIRKDIEDIESNYFKRYDDEVYKLCDIILEKIEGVDKE